MARDPAQPNLRQVHLMQAELFDELMARDFAVWPGDLGENVITSGMALLDLPAGTRLHLGASAVVEATGLRNPCVQLEPVGARPRRYRSLLEFSVEGPATLCVSPRRRLSQWARGLAAYRKAWPRGGRPPGWVAPRQPQWS
jgi:hypothetical protein